MYKINEQVLAIIKSIKHHNCTDEQIMEWDFIEHSLFNSIEFVKLVVALEKHFGIEISDDYLIMDNLRNYTEMTKMISSFLT